MALSSLIALCVLGSFVSSAAADCQNIAAMPNFDLGAYLGTWYYSWQSPPPSPHLSFDCSYSEYSNDGGDITFKKHSNGETKTGRAHPQDGNPGQLEVSLPPGTGTIRVIDTDYTSYSVVVMCINPRPGVPSNEMAVVFSRDKNAPPTLDSLIGKLAPHGFGVLNEVNQDC